MKLNIKAFAMTTAILWGAAMLLITWWIILLDGPSDQATFLAKVYRGYSLTFMGSLIGLIWGIVDGAIGGALLAWLYNRFSVKFE